MADPAKKRATYEDVLAAPEHMVAEVIDGVLPLQLRHRRLGCIEPRDRTLGFLDERGAGVGECEGSRCSLEQLPARLVRRVAGGCEVS